MFSISMETREGVTRHHLDNAIDALAVVEGLQKAAQLPIVITNRATGQFLTSRKFRAGPCPPDLKARSAPPTDIGNVVKVMRITTGEEPEDCGPEDKDPVRRRRSARTAARRERRR